MAISSWREFYEFVYGPTLRPKEMIVKVLRSQEKPISIGELKILLGQAGMPTDQFGTRFAYLYHLLRRLHRARIIQWEANGGIYLAG